MCNVPKESVNWNKEFCIYNLVFGKLNNCAFSKDELMSELNKLDIEIEDYELTDILDKYIGFGKLCKEFGNYRLTALGARRLIW